MFHVKALEFCQRLGKIALAVSDGFISRWKKRHNVVHRSVCGEANSVDLSKVDHFRNETILFTHGKLLHLVWYLDASAMQGSLIPMFLCWPLEEEEEENLPLSVLAQGLHAEVEEDILPLSELAQRLNSAGRLMDVGRPFTADSVSEVLNEDEGMQTTSVPTTDDIVSMIQEANNLNLEKEFDEDTDQEPPKRYSHNQLIQALLDGYFNYQHGYDAEEMSHYVLKLQAWSIRHQPKCSQTKLV